MTMFNDLDKVERCIANIVFKLKTKAKNMSYTPDDAQTAAKRAVLLEDMDLTREAEAEGKLDDLLVETKDDIVNTVGCWGEKTMKEVIGVSALPVLMKNTRAAELYMIKAHNGNDDLNHRGAQDTHARSTSAVWIVNGLQLA